MRIKFTFKLSIMFLLLLGTISSARAQTGDLVKMRTAASTISLQVVYSGSGTIVDANGVTLNSGITIAITPDGSGNVVLKAVGTVTLTELYFNNMSLTALDVSACTALYWLDCANNTLTVLDVSACTALTVLQCYNNTLTKLDVSNNTTLSILNCTNNTLATLDVSTNTALIGLVCVNNKLNALDVSKNTTLTVLDCSNNTLTTLDLSKNTTLKELDCLNNNLTMLDVSTNTALTDLNCANNNLTTLDVTKNTALIKLNCYNNNLTMLDVSTNTVLTVLNCFTNKLTTLDVSANTVLEILDCYNNTLATLDVSKNTAIIRLWCNSNNLTTLNLSGCASLMDFNASSQTITVASGNLNPITYISVTGQAKPIFISGVQYNFGDPLPNGGAFTTNAPVGRDPFSGTITLADTQSTVETQSPAKLTAYPNPTYGQISVTGLTPGVTIRLYTAPGSLVATYKADDEKMTLDLSPLAAGMYFINVDGQTQRVIRK